MERITRNQPAPHEKDHNGEEQPCSGEGCETASLREKLTRFSKAVAAIFPLLGGAPGNSQEFSAISPPEAASHFRKPGRDAEIHKIETTSAASQEAAATEVLPHRLSSLQEVAQYAKEHKEDFGLWLFEGTDDLTFDVSLAFSAFREAYKTLPTPLQLEATRSLLLAFEIVLEPAMVIDFLRSPEVQRILLESSDDVLHELSEKEIARVYFAHPELSIGVPLRTSRERLDPILEGIYNAALQRETQSEDLNTIILTKDDAILAFQRMREQLYERVAPERLDATLRLFDDLLDKAFVTAKEVERFDGITPTKRFILDIFRKLLAAYLQEREQKTGSSLPE